MFFEELFQICENVTESKILHDNRLFVYEIQMLLHAMPRYQHIVDLKHKEYTYIP